MNKIAKIIGFYITTALICTTGISCDNGAIRYPNVHYDGNGLPVYPFEYQQSIIPDAFAVNRNAESQNQEQLNLTPKTAPLPFYQSSQGSNTVDEFEYDNVIKFGWKLFKAAKPANFNYIISPVSPQFLLAQFISGAAGKTKNELINTIEYSDSNDLNRLAESILGNNEGSRNKIDIATAIFPATDVVLNRTFLSKLQQTRAYLSPVDYNNGPNAARYINSWVSQATRRTIETILDPNANLAGTRMMLLNAIYFRGTWAYEFNRTDDKLFSNGNGQRRLTKYMSQTKKYRYGTLENARFVEIPYDKSEFSMVIMVPKQKYQLDQLINEMTPKDLQNLIDELYEENRSNVFLEIPKFSIRSSASLVQPLSQMGLTDFFTKQSKLPFVAQGEKAQVNNIIQQAALNVDEVGTVASAATIVSVITLSITLPVDDVHMLVDEPFLAIIVDKKNKIPLFIAQIYEP